MSAMAIGKFSAMESGLVEEYIFTFPSITGAVSHLMMQFPTLFSSQTTDMLGELSEQEVQTNIKFSKPNRYVYLL